MECKGLSVKKLCSKKGARNEISETFLFHVTMDEKRELGLPHEMKEMGNQEKGYELFFGSRGTIKCCLFHSYPHFRKHARNVDREVVDMYVIEDL